MHDWFIILGARVLDDGSPSGALVRRVRAALDAVADSASPMFLPTGGRGESGYVEARTMRHMLMEAGVSEGQIVCEEAAHDTLGSVRLCSRILRNRTDVARVVVCTDAYHLPRCRALFSIAGFRTEGAPIPSAAKQLPWWRYAYYVTREIAALPLHCSWVLLLKLTGRL
jgi:uncharacterized SAM-binding protein YcdF (DUF218 family)